MKKLLIIGLLFVAATSCSKKDDVKPADQISGSYTISQISSGTQVVNLPYKDATSQLNGTMTVTKKTETSVNVAFTLITVTNGKSDTSSDNADADIKQNGSVIELYDQTGSKSMVGNFTNNTLTIDSDGIKIVAKKN